MKPLVISTLLIAVLVNGQGEVGGWDPDVYNHQQLCFEEPRQFDNRIFSLAETDNILLRGFDRWNAELLLKYMDSFYHLGSSEAISDTTSSGEVGRLYDTKINTITLMENTTLPNTLFIGFGENDNKHVSKDNLLSFKMVIAIQKTNLTNSVSLKSDGWADLSLKSDEALCYHCSSKITDPIPCRLDIALTTIFGYSKVNTEALVHSKLNASEMLTSFNSTLKGENIYKLDFLSRILFSLIGFVPAIGICLIPIGHKCNLYNIENGTFTEKVVYLITRMPFYLYGCCTINFISLAVVNFENFQNVLIGAIFYLCLILYFFAIFYVLPTCVFNCQNLLSGQNINDEETKYIWGTIVLSFIVFVLFIIILIGYKLMFHKVTFLVLMCLLPVSFVFNFIHQSTYHESFFHLIVVSYITLFPFTPLGPFYFPSDDKLWVMYFFVSQLISVVLINLQAKFGSRFMLPNRLRKSYYNTFQHEIHITMREEDMKDACSFCTNLLTEPEVEYQDSKQKLKFIRMKNSKQIYYKLDCGHKFHPYCILSQLKQSRECPICKLYVGKNRFLD
ncbi:unnamed protein product [Moneuplotes crassus]|uniref:RING-type domain-containing protein n=1 Tax=Euplotes crassus TaxID=5936 RepID=A0AAD1YBS0_EUPCR|nr:unnamed protein product [Moneuplotes crassus]